MLRVKNEIMSTKINITSVIQEKKNRI